MLVTGAAGFIGYHLAQHLRSVSAGRPVVVGVDNFNSYYDITLKRDRAAHLIALGVTLHYASVCDVTYMRHLFAAHRFTHVVHCAGEAGVRHSGDAPHAFVEANIGCFAELLDILKEYRVRQCCKPLCQKLYVCNRHVREHYQISLPIDNSYEGIVVLPSFEPLFPFPRCVLYHRVCIWYMHLRPACMDPPPLSRSWRCTHSVTPATCML